MNAANSIGSLQCSDTVVWSLDDRKDIRPTHKLDVGSFVRLIAPVVTPTSIILGSNKIQNGDILIAANPGQSGQWPLKRREIVSIAFLSDTASKQMHIFFHHLIYSLSLF